MNENKRRVTGCGSPANSTENDKHIQQPIKRCCSPRPFRHYLYKLCLNSLVSDCVIGHVSIRLWRKSHLTDEINAISADATFYSALSFINYYLRYIRENTMVLPCLHSLSIYLYRSLQHSNSCGCFSPNSHLIGSL